MQKQILELLKNLSKGDDLIFVFFDGNFTKLQREIFIRIRLYQKGLRPILILGVEDEEVILHDPKWKFLEYFSYNYCYKSLPVNIYELIKDIQFMREIKKDDLSMHFKFIDLPGLWGYCCHDIAKFLGEKNLRNNITEVKKILYEMKQILDTDRKQEINCLSSDIPSIDNLTLENLKSFYNKCCKNRGVKNGDKNFDYR